MTCKEYEISSTRDEIRATHWHERGSYQLIYRALVKLYGEDCDRVEIMANALHEELSENFDLTP